MTIVPLPFHFRISQFIVQFFQNVGHAFRFRFFQTARRHSRRTHCRQIVRLHVTVHRIAMLNVHIVVVVRQIVRICCSHCRRTVVVVVKFIIWYYRSGDGVWQHIDSVRQSVVLLVSIVEIVVVFVRLVSTGIAWKFGQAFDCLVRCIQRTTVVDSCLICRRRQMLLLLLLVVVVVATIRIDRIVIRQDGCVLLDWCVVAASCRFG